MTNETTSASAVKSILFEEAVNDSSHRDRIRILMYSLMASVHDRPITPTSVVFDEKQQPVALNYHFTASPEVLFCWQPSRSAEQLLQLITTNEISIDFSSAAQSLPPEPVTKLCLSRGNKPVWARCWFGEKSYRDALNETIPEAVAHFYAESL